MGQRDHCCCCPGSYSCCRFCNLEQKLSARGWKNFGTMALIRLHHHVSTASAIVIVVGACAGAGGTATLPCNDFLAAET